MIYYKILGYVKTHDLEFHGYDRTIFLFSFLYFFIS